MAVNGIDFCCNCGDYVGAVTFGDKVSGGGTIREGPDGQPEIICRGCEAIEKSYACPVEPGSKSGMIQYEMRHSDNS